MARKADLPTGMAMWFTRRCEDLVLIDAYLKVEADVARDAGLTRELERYFSGVALEDGTLMRLNKILGTRGHGTVVFGEIEPDGTEMLDGAGRAALRHELEAMDEAERARAVDTAWAEVRGAEAIADGGEEGEGDRLTAWFDITVRVPLKASTLKEALDEFGDGHGEVVEIRFSE